MDKILIPNNELQRQFEISLNEFEKNYNALINLIGKADLGKYISDEIEVSDLLLNQVAKVNSKFKSLNLKNEKLYELYDVPVNQIKAFLQSILVSDFATIIDANGDINLDSLEQIKTQKTNIVLAGNKALIYQKLLDTSNELESSLNELKIDLLSYLNYNRTTKKYHINLTKLIAGL